MNKLPGLMAVRLLQIREATAKQFNSSAEVAAEFLIEAQADRECFWVVHLNTKNAIIEKELAAMGTLDQASICPREIFRKAVVNSTASIIGVHNHPSGDPEPSFADRQVCQQLVGAGTLLGVKVLDFVVLGHGGRFVSFADRGLIDHMRNQTTEEVLR